MKTKFFTLFTALFLSSSMMAIEPISCAEAAELALSVYADNILYNGDETSGELFVVRGYVTEIATNYNSTYNNLSFWLADTKNGGRVLKAYRCTPESTNKIPKVGDYVEVFGCLTKYQGIPEFAQYCGCAIIGEFGRLHIGDMYYNLDTINRTAEVTYEGHYYTDEYNFDWDPIVANIPDTIEYEGIKYYVTSIGDHAFYGCENLVNVTIPHGVINVGYQAFKGCNSLPVLDNIRYADSYLVNVVDKQLQTYSIRVGTKWIGDEAFWWCGHMTSIDIPDGVIAIGESAFSDCAELASVRIPNSVATIGNSAFYGYNKLTSITIPNSITSIGKWAFNHCTLLNTIKIETEIPPMLGEGVFSNTRLSKIFVPCGAIDIYTSASGWSSFANFMQYKPLDYVVTIIPSEFGQVATPVLECDIPLFAIPNYGYHFTQWNDGNTDNPRTIVLTQDTTFAAEFAPDKSGICGADSALTWSLDDESKTLTISGSGALTENYTFGVEAPIQMNTLIIGDGVTSIGDSAFYATKTLNHLFIGANVASIGNYAFAECRNFDDITCYATIVPTINATTFANVGNKQYIYLYVPEDRERAYRRDEFWGEFDIRIKGTEETTTDTKSVSVEPADNTALFTWPTDSAAASYSLQIMKDGEVFCTLTFNANGQLTGIAFAPSRNGAAHAQAATMSVSAMSFTVTGLNSASKYAYRLSVTDESQNEIQAYSGEFATTGYVGEVKEGGEPEINTEGFEDVLSTEKATKILRNGQILILRADKTYTLQSQEVK